MAIVLLALVAVSFGSFAQMPILSFSFEDASLEIPVGEATTSLIRVTNDSVYDADDVEIALLSTTVELAPVEPIKVVDAFSSSSMNLYIRVLEDAAVGSDELRFELSYTYCIGELCFQIVEEMSLSLEIVASPIEPVDSATLEPITDPGTDPIMIPEPSTPAVRTTYWALLFPISLALILAIALLASKVAGRRWWVIGLLLIVLAGGLGYGISLRQDQQAQSIGAVLCTSCVGIEETPHNVPEFSAAGAARIRALTREIELRIFSATWCHACPYAKELVRQAALLNPLITTQVIDVDVDREVADRYGVIQSGRTIVPAILRVDTGEVLFGIEDLEKRLIDLLEETP